mmetsp:Transcript_10354/g.24173  ORF Transcript_10354/g.24173 Transcript_10354/m.24173 type:complete len:102 (+) Transcript_10354:2-307(+)
MGGQGMGPGGPGMGMGGPGIGTGGGMGGNMGMGMTSVPAAGGTQQQAHVQAKPPVTLGGAGRSKTFVQPNLGGEKTIYHRDGTVEIETADGERIAEEDAFD